MIVEALLIRTQNWNETIHSSSSDGLYTVLDPYYGLPLSNNKEQTTDTCNTWMIIQGMKKSNFESLYTIWFWFYNIFEKIQF